MRIKPEHLLIAIIVLFGLHLLMNRCRCNGFSVGGLSNCQDLWESQKNLPDEHHVCGGEKWRNLDAHDQVITADTIMDCCQFMIPYVDLTKVQKVGQKLKYKGESGEIILEPRGEMAHGSFGKVYKFSNATEDIAVALKVFNDDKKLDSIREIEVVEGIQTLKGKTSYGCDTIDSRVLDGGGGVGKAILMEIMDGDLINLLYAEDERYDEYRIKTATTNTLKEEYIIPILIKLAIDLKCLFRLKYIYTDLKNQNILFKIDPKGEIHVKLGDLGSIRNINPADPAVLGALFAKNDLQHVYQKLAEGGFGTLDEMQKLRELVKAGEDGALALEKEIRNSSPRWAGGKPLIWAEDIPEIPDICITASYPIPEYSLIENYKCSPMNLLVLQLGAILLTLSGFYNHLKDTGPLFWSKLDADGYAGKGRDVDEYYTSLNTEIDDKTNIENAKLIRLRDEIFRINDISELKINLDGVLEILDPEGYSSGYYAN